MPTTTIRAKRSRNLTIRPFGGSLRLSARIVPERAGGYSCSVPQIPGCFSCGDTLREARLMITEAAEACLINLVGSQPSFELESVPLPDGRKVRRRDGEAISVWIDSDEADGFVSARILALGVDAFAADRDELVEAVREQLAVNWTEYAEASDSSLSREARELKRRLLDVLEAVGD